MSENKLTPKEFLSNVDVIGMTGIIADNHKMKLDEAKHLHAKVTAGTATEEEKEIYKEKYETMINGMNYIAQYIDTDNLDALSAIPRLLQSLSELIGQQREIFKSGRYWTIYLGDPNRQKRQYAGDVLLVINGDEKKRPDLNGRLLFEITTEIQEQITGLKFINFELYKLFKAEPPKFRQIKQSAATNKLTQRLTTKITEPAQLDLYGNGVIKDTDLTILIREYAKTKEPIRDTAVQLYYALLIKLNDDGQIGKTGVKITLEEFMNWRGLKNIKETRRQVKQDIDHLKRIEFSFTGKRKYDDWLDVSLYGGASGIKNSVIYFAFSEVFLSMIDKSTMMYLPIDILKINTKYNRLAFYLMKKFCEHDRINLEKPDEKRYIKVKTLLASIPNIKLNRINWKEKIYKPFMRDMKYLSGESENSDEPLEPMIDWRFKSGIGEAGEAIEHEAYDEFLEDYIMFTIIDKPEQTKLKEKREKHQQEKKRRKKDTKNMKQMEKRLNELESKLDLFSHAEQNSNGE